MVNLDLIELISKKNGTRRGGNDSASEDNQTGNISHREEMEFYTNQFGMLSNNRKV